MKVSPAARGLAEPKAAGHPVVGAVLLVLGVFAALSSCRSRTRLDGAEW